MPHLPRIDVPGLICHITNRGVKRLPIFHDDEDRQRFLGLLSRAKEEYPFVFHSYCLMTNRYHLLLQTLQGSLSRTMQFFNSLFASAFNRKNNHVVHVFQGRFHSIPVQEDAYFTTVSRYIHLNPVKAGIVARAEDHPWSSYGRLLRAEPDRRVDPTLLLGYFGPDTRFQREKYKRFVITHQTLQRLRYWASHLKPNLLWHRKCTTFRLWVRPRSPDLDLRRARTLRTGAHPLQRRGRIGS